MSLRKSTITSVADWEHWVATVKTLVYRGRAATPDAASKLAALLDEGNRAGYVRSAVAAELPSEQWIDVRDHLLENGYELLGTEIEPRHLQSLLALRDDGLRIAPNGRLRRVAAANHTDWGIDVEAAVGTEIAYGKPVTIKFIGFSGTQTFEYHGVFRNDVSGNVFLKYSEIRMLDMDTIEYIDVPADSRAA